MIVRTALVVLLAAALTTGCSPGTADDQAVIEQLGEAGADLSQPREVRFYLYLPNEPAARAVGVIVQGGQRAVAVEPAATGDEWLVLVTEMLVVDLDAIGQRGEEFTRAVDAYGGEYDGWEAAVSP